MNGSRRMVDDDREKGCGFIFHTARLQRHSSVGSKQVEMTYSNSLPHTAIQLDYSVTAV